MARTLAVMHGSQVLEMPAIFHAADASSLADQRRFLRATKLRLVTLTVAAGAGGVSLIVGRADYAGILAAAAFVAALAAEVFILQTQPDRVWYKGRAAAESAKTLAWRYAVGGEPFGLTSVTGADADRLLVERFKDLLHDLDELDLYSTLVVGQQITPTMRALRSETLEVRKAAYETDRIADQQAWYATKARWNAVRARRWSAAMVTVEALGGIGAIVKASGRLSGTALVLGLFGAAGAAIAAWVQTRQHQALASAYSVAANELASIRSLISWQTTEESWAAFVSDAEQAISREHSLWCSSRGVRATAPFGG
jgi:SMODS and SLOG-associating 2TM effector domain 3/SMODS and SLOG-associating 2TM effector domain 1